MQFELLPPVPTVALARQLRQISLFRFASVDELFRISAIACQVRHEEGRTFQEKGAPAEYMQLLVEGRIAVCGSQPDEKELTPPALLGFREVLEGVPLRETARAVKTSICLALGAEDFRTLLSDNIELAAGLFRMLLGSPSPDGSPSLLKGAVHPKPRGRAKDGGSELRPIEKVLLLQELPIFSRATAEELLGLANTTGQIRLHEGQPIFDEGDPPSIYVVLSGTLVIEPSQGGPKMLVNAGDALGVNETLAGVSMGWRGRTGEEGSALRIERDGLFELLCNEMDFLQGLFAALFQLTG
ncbi:MAG: cyclic nucleotide-binding domain-containing protein [Acidobacteriota bacterium]